MTNPLRLLPAALLVLAASGCTIIADLDSYVSADDLGCDMDVAVEAFAPHLTDRVYYQAVTREGNVLRALAIIDPLGTPNRAFTMPNAIREGAHALQFWADENDDGLVQTTPFDNGLDHSWRFDDVCSWPSSCSDDDTNCFLHVGLFDRISDPVEEGNTLTVNLPGLPDTAGVLELHLVEVDEVTQIDSVVGLYRTDDVTTTDFSVELRGLAFPGRGYAVNVLIDLDGNAQIDGLTEVFSLPAQDGSTYADPITIDVSTFDPAGSLPEEGILVSAIPAP